MEPLTTHTGIGVPLRRSNVDTDQIIPAVYLAGHTHRVRGRPVFVVAHRSGLYPQQRAVQPRFGAGRRPDFGTGSSREHAVWALMDFGFRVVLSSRFADIFRGNSGKAGLLAAQVDQGDIELIWKRLENEPGLELTVDLADRTVTAG